MSKSNLKVLFVGKDQGQHCAKALEFVKENFRNVSVFLGGWGESFPQAARDWEGDYVFSYLSRWVVPEEVLRRTHKAAINFHSGSPEYPGVGCNNFALYEDAKEYGVTCHHMAREVDTGEIISVKRFPIFPSDNVHTLLNRTWDYQLIQFYEIVEKILVGDALPVSQEKWTRKPFSRTEFNQLFIIRPEMPTEEVRRRVRATSYGVYQPYVSIGDLKFKLDPVEPVK